MNAKKRKSKVVTAVETALGSRYISIPFHAPFMEDDVNETWFKAAEKCFVHVDVIGEDIVIDWSNHECC